MIGLPLEVQVLQDSGQVTLIVHGEIDIATVPRLTEYLDDALRAGHADVLVDLRDVDFIDGAGMGALVVAAERIRRSGRSLKLVNVGSRLRRILDVGRVTDIVDVVETG